MKKRFAAVRPGASGAAGPASLFAVAVAAILVALACARTGPPPGGPVDDIPPEIVLTEPADGATGIGVPYRIAVHFSEKMNKRSVEKNLLLHPEPEWVRLSWEKNRITVDTLEREVTTLVIETSLSTGRALTGETTVGISGYSEDRRGNSLGRPCEFTFTSGDTLPAGEVGGFVSGAKATRDAPPVTVSALAIDSGASPAAPPRSLRVGQAGRQGNYLLRHLPVGEDRPFAIFAFRDDDDDGAVDYDFEYYGRSDTLRLTGAAPRIDSLEIALVNADTPASLAGRVTSDHPLDSTEVYLESADDTTFYATARPDSLGDYSFSRLASGEYVIRLLTGSPEKIDSEGPEGAEGEIVRRTLRLEPGEKRELYDIPEKRPEKPPSEVAPGTAPGEVPDGG